jgi:hypothetical protein
VTLNATHVANAEKLIPVANLGPKASKGLIQCGPHPNGVAGR